MQRIKKRSKLQSKLNK